MIEKNHLQKLIIELWVELLDLDSVAPQDEFLDLGGSSIQAIQFICRFREVCGLEVPLKMMFDHGSPSSIASALAVPLKL
jgi:aryl carrier-like protein